MPAWPVGLPAGAREAVVERALLTDEFVEGCRPLKDREVRIWDERVNGFCLRIHASGRKVYCLRDVVAGRQVWRTIGTHADPWFAEEARTAAEKIVHERQRKEPRPLSPSGRVDLTVRQLIGRYLNEGPVTKLDKRGSSWKADASYLRSHVEPAIGDRFLGELRHDDIAQMIRNIWAGSVPRDVRVSRRGVARIRGGPGAAGRALDTVAAMFAWAVARELMAKNPALGIKLPRRPSRARFLSAAQARSLFQVLQRLEQSGHVNPIHGAAIRLLLLTGARKSEIVCLKWEEIDLEQRRIVLPPDRSKTGGKTGERRIPLSQPAIDILACLPRASAFALPCAKGDSGHFTGLQKTWTFVRGQAGLDGFRIHDLRHSFASFAMANGENIVAISRALGHADLRTTQIYLHLNDSLVTDLAERTARTVMGA